MKVHDKTWVYDIEQYPNLHTSVWINYNTREKKIFVIHYLQDNSKEYRDFLLSDIIGVGFNNLSYDYPILHEFINKCKNTDPNKTNDILYNKSQDHFEQENSKFSRIDKPYFSQIDLFAIRHYDNKAKTTSLKSLQCNLDFKNVKESTIPFNQEIHTMDDILEVISYNINDTESTVEFVKPNLESIKLRYDIKRLKKIDCINYSDSKLGEQLVLDEYCKQLNIKYNTIKNLRTQRESINIPDLYFDYIDVKNQKITSYLSTKNTNSKLKVTGQTANIKYEIARGGIHGSVTGLFKSNKDEVILDIDVASLYPNIIANNNLYPEHLGQVFITIYKSIIDLRLYHKARKKIDPVSKVLDGTYKLALNSCYGKFGDEYSPLNDSKRMYQTTINGQLTIVMLLEKLEEEIKDIFFIQANTDGITVRIKRSQIERFREVVKEFGERTKYEFEEVEYSIMAVRDVNNYLAIDINGKKKHKGEYVYDIEEEYHKDNSFRIVKEAVSLYFFNGSPITETIKKETNFFKFLGRQKFKSNGDQASKGYFVDNNNRRKETQKVQRYYIANDGYGFIKKSLKTAKISRINQGYTVQDANLVEDNKIPDDLNYQFYYDYANKLIFNIVGNQNQLKLEF